MINELARFPTRSDNVYFANNEQASNQIYSPLKNSQSINAESACDRNNKSMYSCFYESKKFLICFMY